MMFCKQCGTEIKEGSAFCPSCGAPIAQQDQQPQVQNTAPQQMPLDANAQPQVQQPYPAMAQAQSLPQKKNNKNLFIILAAVGGVVIIAVIILIISLSSNRSSCSSVVSKYADAMSTGNVDEMIEVLPPDYVSYRVRERYDGDYEEFKESIDSSYDISSSYGVSVQMNIIDERHCTDSKSLKKVNEYYQDNYDATNYISELAKCKVSSSVVYSGYGTPSIDTDTMYFIKVNDQWYIDRSGAASSISSRYYK